MSKNWLILLTLTVILITALLTFLVNNSLPNKVLSRSEVDTAVNQAKHLYRQEKDLGRDFAQGP